MTEPAPPLTVKDLFVGAGQWFAILDAARGPQVRAWIRQSGMETQSLYEGESAEEHDEWAPFLVKLATDAPAFSELLEKGWGDAWGIFIQSHASFADVRRHFRKFLKVRLPEGELAYFRFYDPRVLRDFLPSFSLNELPEFCGPIRLFVLEAQNGDPLCYSWGDEE